MLAEWIRAVLDVVLIGLVGAGLVQATRLIRHLSGLRASRAEMERFVHDFNATVIRAESGIKNLKQAARESGDDLEKLVDKSLMVRDELHFIVESADQLANRLSVAASASLRMAPKPPEAPQPPAVEPKPAPKASPIMEQPKATAAAPPPATRKEPEAKPASRAEKDLMQALQKLN